MISFHHSCEHRSSYQQHKGHQSHVEIIADEAVSLCFGKSPNGDHNQVPFSVDTAVKDHQLKGFPLSINL